ncbi:MAG: hypothetical protein OEW37_00010 [Rhodospirillaceae bacterium]|nr:hypothetical protein [Rhodospirillaceae bacterium]
MKMIIASIVITIFTIYTPANAETSFNLSWTNTNTELVTFNVYQDGAQIATGLNTPSYSTDALKAGQYNYYVTAVANSIESEPSNTAVGIAKPAPPGAFAIDSATVIIPAK